MCDLIGHLPGFYRGYTLVTVVTVCGYTVVTVVTVGTLGSTVGSSLVLLVSVTYFLLLMEITAVGTSGSPLIGWASGSISIFTGSLGACWRTSACQSGNYYLHVWKRSDHRTETLCAGVRPCGDQRTMLGLYKTWFRYWLCCHTPA